LPPPVSLDADDQALLDQVIGYYHETLKKSPEALGYSQRRGIGSSEAVERFKLGFADRTLGLRLPNQERNFFAAETGAQNPPFRLLETGIETRRDSKSPRSGGISATKLNGVRSL
jgi:hypothetical protein